jgi:hypothetical protein
VLRDAIGLSEQDIQRLIVDNPRAVLQSIR